MNETEVRYLTIRTLRFCKESKPFSAMWLLNLIPSSPLYLIFGVR
jgi:hypothetical protein